MIIIYARADIARELEVTPSAVSNWIRRHNDWPLPTFETPEGLMYWDTQGFQAWRQWSKKRKPAGQSPAGDLDSADCCVSCGEHFSDPHAPDCSQG